MDSKTKDEEIKKQPSALAKITVESPKVVVDEDHTEISENSEDSFLTEGGGEADKMICTALYAFQVGHNIFVNRRHIKI